MHDGAPDTQEEPEILVVLDRINEIISDLQRCRSDIDSSLMSLTESLEPVLRSRDSDEESGTSKSESSAKTPLGGELKKIANKLASLLRQMDLTDEEINRIERRLEL